MTSENDNNTAAGDAESIVIPDAESNLKYDMFNFLEVC